MLLFTAPRDALLAPLQSVSGIVEKRHTLPILSNVLIEKKGEALTLLATDIEIQIRNRTTAALGAEDVAITVGARKLQDILRALPDSAEVQLTLDDKRITLKAGKSRFQLQTLPAADYPRLAPPEGEGVHFSTTQKAFKKQHFAMAVHDIRYYLNGILFIAEGKTLTLVATDDGHRLALAQAGLAAEVPSRQEVILPRKTVLELQRLLRDEDAPIEMRFAANQAKFRFSGMEFVTKLSLVLFPDYNRVIPLNNTKLLTIDRVQLQQALQRAAILSNEKFRGVRVVLMNGLFRIICSNSEQEEAQEELEVDYQGEALDVGFNITYLLDVLNNVANESVNFAFGDANSSALVTLPGNDRFKYVVMPMRI